MNMSGQQQYNPYNTGYSYQTMGGFNSGVGNFYLIKGMYNQGINMNMMSTQSNQSNMNMNLGFNMNPNNIKNTNNNAFNNAGPNQKSNFTPFDM